MNGIDGHFHSKLRDLLGTYSSLESEYSSSLKAGMEIVLAEVVKINQAADLADFLRLNAVIFETQDEFMLEPYEGDPHKEIVLTENNTVTLGFKLSRLVTTYEELQALVAKKEREVNGLESIIDVYSKTPAFGNADSPMEVLIDSMCDRFTMKQYISAKTELNLVQLQALKHKIQIDLLQDIGGTFLAPVVFV